MLIFALLILLAAPVWSQGRRPAVPQDTPYQTVSADAFRFRCLEDDQGGFYLVWPRSQADGVAVSGQHLNGQGKELWPAEGQSLITGLPAGSTWAVVPDTQGGVIVVWEAAERVWARRFTPEGRPAWPPKNEKLTISTSTQALPALVPDGSGGAFIAWQEKRLPARWVLMAQHINALGAPLWTSQGTRVSLRPSDQKRPSAVYDGSAGVIVAWHDLRESASQLQAQRLDYQGNRLWGLEGTVITAPSGDPLKVPHLGAVGGGAAIFAWQASSSAADRIFLQLVGGSGKMAWKITGIDLTVGNWSEWNPVLHGDGQGGSWVGWEDYRSNVNWTVYIKHILISGLPGWPENETQVASLPVDQGHLALTDDEQGGMLAGWVDNRQGATGIYLQEINPQGQALLGPDGLRVSSHLANPQTPQLLSVSTTTVVVAWADTPSKGQWRLFWKRLTLSSQPPK